MTYQVIETRIQGKDVRFLARGREEARAILRILEGAGCRIERWEVIYSGFDPKRARAFLREAV